MKHENERKKNKRLEILKKFQNIKNIKIFSLLSCFTFLYFEKRSKPKFTRKKKILGSLFV